MLKFVIKYYICNAMTTPIFNLEHALNAFMYVANRLDITDIHRIFKVLYFADKQHLSNYLRPITGDTYIAMDDGPVPTNLYDIVKEVDNRGHWNGERKSMIFTSLFSINKNMFVKPLKDADLDFLSISDIEELDKSIEKYGALSHELLSTISHAYAWQRTSRNSAMDLDNILRENGEGEDFIKHIAEDIAFVKALS